MIINSLFSTIIVVIVSTLNIGAQNVTSGVQNAIDRLIAELNVSSKDPILIWNLATLHACANDYDTEIAAHPDQPGPTATSRAFAIIHAAMYDVFTLYNQRSNYVLLLSDSPSFNERADVKIRHAAIMEAAYQTLIALYPKQISIFDAVRDFHYKRLNTTSEQHLKLQSGISNGRKTALLILEKRKLDGSEQNKIYNVKDMLGFHKKDPTHPNQGYLGTGWGDLKPFLLDSPSQYRPSDIVGTTNESRAVYLKSPQYIADFNEIIALGGKNSTQRTSDQTEIGNFWAYDGASKIGVPPRLYNQIVRIIAIDQRNVLSQNARLFALVNCAMADAAIACWECKYHYDFWRPIVAVREGSEGTPSDPNWLPLGAGKNDLTDNFTPGFPAYVSGHATFGSACFEILRLFYNKDNISFAFQSDEYNGKTIDTSTGVARPQRSRQYQSFSQAETENEDSRIYLGVHWRKDVEEGRILGRKVAQHIFRKVS